MQNNLKKLARLLCLLLCAGPIFAQSTFNINLDSIRSSVVFLHVIDAAGQLKEAGTGFLLLAPVSGSNRGYILLVTARHIADPQWANCSPRQGQLFAVFNKKNFDFAKDDSGIVRVPLGTQWMFPDADDADVAVAVINASAFQQLDLDNTPMSLSELPTPDELKMIDSGSQIASAGLLLGASGMKRNYPVFKFGYVSSRPDEKIGVPCYVGGKAKETTNWLVAASLVAGNSGSPIYFVPVGFPGISMGQRPFLLGVQSLSFSGSDLAGMAPVNYLINAISKLQLPGVDLSKFLPASPLTPVVPTSAHPAPPSVPLTSIPQPKSTKK